METPTFGVLIAFSAGLLSFLSPCVLPLIPSYVTFITGLSLDDVQHARKAALIHGSLFVLGFTLIFLAMGAGATMLGQVLIQNRDWISRIGGVVIIVFGLYLLGVLNIGFLSRERRFHVADKPVGYLGTMVVGIAFGAGWTPCLGPILGSILLYTGTQADLGRGMLLLFAYSLGLAVPFLLSAVAIERFTGFFQRMRKQMIWISRISGAVMIVIGVMLVTNYFTVLASWLTTLTPEFLLERI
ncbi:MAG TPA: cytochrome c biogenesis protein CcdA [Gemmatimonadaceae bacterium]|nr:cytochrome c biogenesis protein CcdA [Gemmatimonadaceae bacterium]